jgi:hypothetical protein
MGCGGSLPVDETTKALDAQLREEKQRIAKEVKLLLLGAVRRLPL